jgi:hypothetical protein
MRNIVMERFSKEELLIYYQYVGLYFSNNIPEIIQQSRLISTHPLLLNCNDTSLWDYKAIINQRRCRESMVNLLKAELLYEAVQELCSFDYIYACTSSRIHEHIVGDLNKLCNKILECQIAFKYFKIVDNTVGKTVNYYLDGRKHNHFGPATIYKDDNLEYKKYYIDGNI